VPFEEEPTVTVVDEPPMDSPTLTVDGEGIALLLFDDPDRSVNVLSAQVLARLQERIEEIGLRSGSRGIRALLIASGKSSFLAGANLDEIAGVRTTVEGEAAARRGQEIYLALERLSIPTLAAIHGASMGGGTELALACRYRVASDDPKTRIGLPEVQLGILPAWGGTTRLPRQIGLQRSLDLLLTGKSLASRRARALGLVDAILPHQDFLLHAHRHLGRLLQEGGGRPRRPPLHLRALDALPPARRVLLTLARRRTLQETGGHYPAPLRILEVLERSSGRSLESALDIEATAAGELIASATSKHLIRLFRLREAARRIPPEFGDPNAAPIRSIGILGAGVMGGGIAQLAAAQGLDARLRDLRSEAIGDALRQARELFQAALSRHRITPRELREGMDRISGTTDLSGFRRRDLILEAVVEREEVKAAVLAEMEGLVSRECILATNTSSLSVDALAASLTYPERFLGIHFFNPVHRMPLVEIVRGNATDPTVVGRALALALRLGKTPIVVRDGAGFLVNRILGPYLNEAGYLLMEGYSVSAIDGAARAFGLPMGPLRLIDEVGIDVARHAGDSLHRAFGERLAPNRALLALGATKRLGKKGGLGLYRYPKGREASPDPGLRELLGGEIAPPREAQDPALILDRLLLAMVNEAARVLEDRIVDTAGEVDLGMIMGAGFPPHTGGLLRWADAETLPSVVERLEALQVTVGSRFTPAPLLLDLAGHRRGFHDTFPSPR